MEDIIKLQTEIEQTFSLDYVEDQYESQWFPILKPLIDTLIEEGNEEKFIERILTLSIRILYILSSRGNVMYHNLIEMCINRTNRDESIVFAGFVLDLGAEYELWEYDQIPVNDNALRVRARYTTSGDFIEASRLCMYPLPMLCEPIKVKEHRNNRGSGYLTQPNDSLILNGKHHLGNLCREYLDKVNSIRYRLNTELFEYFDHILDEEKIIENVIKNNSERGEFISPHKAAQQAVENHDVRIQQTKIGREVLADNTFYFTHKYDNRGRVYCQGYHFNYQGDSYDKASIELYTSDIISDDINFNL